MFSLLPSSGGGEPAVSRPLYSSSGSSSGGGVTATRTPLARATASPTSRPPRKKALLIGINYYGTAAELGGCINDVRNVQELCKLRLHITDFHVLVDVPGAPASFRPTRANILAGFEWLLAGAEAGDVLFLHYSGHGTYVPDSADADAEVTGSDSCIVPLDYSAAGVLTDDALRTQLVNAVPAGVTLFAVFDSCYSGSVLDLRYTYTDDSRGPTARARTLAGGRAAPDFGAWRSAAVASENLSVPETGGAVVMLSGASDLQTAADAWIGGLSQGAMSWALLESLSSIHLHGISLGGLLTRVRALLASNGYSQVPQMESGQLLDLAVPLGRLIAAPI